MTGRFFLLLSFTLVAGCDSCSSRQAGSSAGTDAGTSPAPKSTASATTTLEDDLCKGQPYKKRCEKACKEAAAKVTSGPCAAEMSAFMSVTAADFGSCLAGCTPKSDITCVGAEDPGHCDCKLKCYRGLSPETLEKARAAARCQHKEIVAACE